MAVLTQGDAGVLPVLFNVMGVAWWRGVADTAWQLLNLSYVRSLSRRQFIVHSASLSCVLLVASCERQTSILACAAIRSHRSFSSTSTASLSPAKRDAYSS